MLSVRCGCQRWPSRIQCFLNQSMDSKTFQWRGGSWNVTSVGRGVLVRVLVSSVASKTVTPLFTLPVRNKPAFTWTCGLKKATGSMASSPPASSRYDTFRQLVANWEITISHLDRILSPGDSYAKGLESSTVKIVRAVTIKSRGANGSTQ